MGNPTAVDVASFPDRQNEVIRERNAKLLEKYGIKRKAAEVVFLLFGQGGVNASKDLVNDLDPEIDTFARIFIGNTDAQQLEGLLCAEEDARPQYLDKWTELPLERFNIVQVGESGGGAGGDPQVAAEKFKEKKELVRAFAQNATVAFVVVGMGGGTGTGIAPEVADLLAELKTTGVLTFGFMPFAFEGENRVHLAEEVRARIAGKGCIATIYNNELYNVARVSKDEKLREALKNQNIHMLIPAVNRLGLRPMLQAVQHLGLREATTINRDVEDLRTVIQSGVEAYIGSVEYPKADESKDKFTIHKAIGIVLGNHFLNPEMIKDCEKGIVLFQGDFSASEVQIGMDAITKAMKGDDPEKKISLIPGLDANSDRKRIFFMATSPKLSEPKRGAAVQTEAHSVDPEEAQREAEKFDNLTPDDLASGERTKSLRLTVDKDGKPYELREDVSVTPTFHWAYMYYRQHHRNWSRDKHKAVLDLLDAYVATLFDKDRYRLYRPPEIRFASEGPAPEAQSDLPSGVAYNIPPQKEKRRWWQR